MSITPASQISAEESLAEIRDASRRVEIAFNELNRLIHRETTRVALVQKETATLKIPVEVR